MHSGNSPDRLNSWEIISCFCDLPFNPEERKERLSRCDGELAGMDSKRVTEREDDARQEYVPKRKVLSSVWKFFGFKTSGTEQKTVHCKLCRAIVDANRNTCNLLHRLNVMEWWSMKSDGVWKRDGVWRVFGIMLVKSRTILCHEPKWNGKTERADDYGCICLRFCLWQKNVRDETK